SIGFEFTADSHANHPRVPDPPQRRKQEVFSQQLEIPHVLPEKQMLVSAHDDTNESFSEQPGAGAVLMKDVTADSQEAIPADFPGTIRDVGVFNVERVVKRIKSP